MTGRERPYRSHLRPACRPCRQRKSRCTSSADGDACLSCQIHGTDCVYPNAEDRHTQQAATPTHGPTAKRKRTTHDSNTVELRSPPADSALFGHQLPQTVPSSPVYVRGEEDYTTLARCSPLVDHTRLVVSAEDHLAETDQSIHHIVGPTPAFDHDVLQKYLSSVYVPSTPQYSVAQARGSGRAPVEEVTTPVMFDTIQKRPLGVSDRQSVAASKCEIIEKVIGISTRYSVDLYLKVVNQIFPLFDDASFKRLFRDSETNISPALLANLYAAALPYWSTSSELASCRRPDVRYIWVQAGEALYSELWHAPSMSVIIAIILNTNGRPSTSMLGNGGLLGFAISLAHSLGLNRNPREWQVSHMEKSLRIRIWWLLVIFDKWQSLGYGTPSRMRWAQSDVPYPTLEELNVTDRASDDARTAGLIYIAFLTLTEVLDRCLDYVYCLDEHHRSLLQTPRDLEISLRQWEESLEDQVREIIIHGASLDLPGATNLRLAYLGVKLFLCKIQLDLDVKSSQMSTANDNNTSNTMNNDRDPLSWRLMQSQRAAEDIVYFVKQLRAHHLTGFWSPICAFALTSATTFLLRRAIRWTLPTMRTTTRQRRQSSTDQQRNVPLRMAKEMLDTLQRYRREYDWDIAEDCLRRCADIFTKITTTNASGDGGGDATPEIGGQAQSENLMEQFALEDLFPDIWGMLET